MLGWGRSAVWGCWRVGVLTSFLSRDCTLATIGARLLPTYSQSFSSSDLLYICVITLLAYFNYICDLQPRFSCDRSIHTHTLPTSSLLPSQRWPCNLGLKSPTNDHSTTLPDSKPHHRTPPPRSHHKLQRHPLHSRTRIYHTSLQSILYLSSRYRACVVLPFYTPTL